MKSWHCKIVACAVAAAALLSGCGPTRLDVRPSIPPLLMSPMPLSMGVRIPKSFSEYVQKEKTQEREWVITLGPGQADAVKTVTAAMFEHTLVLGDQAPGDQSAIASHNLNGILETTLDSYVYLLPSPGGADFFSATIGYKVNLHALDGTLLGSWIYEGYGSAPSRGLSNAKGVTRVTALAIRDACANLAAHLPDQELVRNLLAPPAAPGGGAAPPDRSEPQAAQSAAPLAAPPASPAPPAVTVMPEAASAPPTPGSEAHAGTGS